MYTYEYPAEVVLQRAAESRAKDAEIARLRAALTQARHFLRPPAGSHYPHGVAYAVQEIDAALGGPPPR